MKGFSTFSVISGHSRQLQIFQQLRTRKLSFPCQLSNDHTNLQSIWHARVLSQKRKDKGNLCLRCCYTFFTCFKTSFTIQVLYLSEKYHFAALLTLRSSGSSYLSCAIWSQSYSYFWHKVLSNQCCLAPQTYLLSLATFALLGTLYFLWSDTNMERLPTQNAQQPLIDLRSGFRCTWRENFVEIQHLTNILWFFQCRLDA